MIMIMIIIIIIINIIIIIITIINNTLTDNVVVLFIQILPDYYRLVSVFGI